MVFAWSPKTVPPLGCAKARRDRAIDSSPMIYKVAIVIPILAFAVFMQEYYSFFFNSKRNMKITTNAFDKSMSRALVAFIGLPSCYLSSADISLVGLPQG